MDKINKKQWGCTTNVGMEGEEEGPGRAGGAGEGGKCVVLLKLKVSRAALFQENRKQVVQKPGQDNKKKIVL